jgi:ADP-ribose pyrophosphatase
MASRHAGDCKSWLEPQEKGLSHTTRSIFEGRVIRLGIESLTLPNGTQLDLEIVRHPGGAAVVAINAQQQVCLLRQYRHAGGGWLWELPAGKLEPDEAPEVTAQRELQEEAGVQAGCWEKLGSILVTPGFCDEVIHLFMAGALTLGTPQPETHELFEVHWVPLKDALAQVHNGTITDAKTMLGLMLADRLLGQRLRQDPDAIQGTTATTKR